MRVFLRNVAPVHSPLGVVAGWVNVVLLALGGRCGFSPCRRDDAGVVVRVHEHWATGRAWRSQTTIILTVSFMPWLGSGSDEYPCERHVEDTLALAR